jgi:DNA-binding MarR family transcriptional regulator
MLASAVVARAMERDAEASGGLGMSEHHLLAILADAPGRVMRPTELAERSPLTKSGLTRAVDRLASLGLLERRVCPSDGRGQLVALTARGLRAMRRAAPGHFRAIARSFADYLTDREADTIALALERVVAGSSNEGRAAS